LVRAAGLVNGLGHGDGETKTQTLTKTILAAMTIYHDPNDPIKNVNMLHTFFPEPLNRKPGHISGATIFTFGDFSGGTTMKQVFFTRCFRIH
jgi:hypothetical protein